MKTISTVACTIAATLAIVSTSPAFSQSAPKQQQAQESTGESNSQHQLGGQKRDRRVSHEMFRDSQNRMEYRSRHAYRHENKAQ